MDYPCIILIIPLLSHYITHSGNASKMTKINGACFSQAAGLPPMVSLTNCAAVPGKSTTAFVAGGFFVVKTIQKNIPKIIHTIHTITYDIYIHFYETLI